MQLELRWKNTVKGRVKKRWSRHRNMTADGERIPPNTWHYKKVDSTLLSKWKIRCVMAKVVENEMERDELLAEYKQIILSDTWENVLEGDR